jgi:putative thiamine transport system permease protein
VETLTTEAVALSSGGNRRVIGAYGLLQMALPALGFALALTLPRLIFANRRGMWAGAPA